MNLRFQHRPRPLRHCPALLRPSARVLAVAGIWIAILAALLTCDTHAAEARSAGANGRVKTAAKNGKSAPPPAASEMATHTAASQPSDAPATPPIPQSVFLLSSPTQTLRDPFFPNSTRLSAVAAKTSGQKKDTPAAELVLKAIFGTPARPFATINSTTLGRGEEQDVATSAGRVRVRCLEINLAAQSVLIEVGGSRRELRFAASK